MSAVVLSSDQAIVYDAMREWAERPNELLTVGGLGGCGKTAITGHLAHEIDSSHTVAYVAFTARAASVLRKVLPPCVDDKPKAPPDMRETSETRRFYSFRKDGSSFCGTLHQLLYRPKMNDREELLGWEPRTELDQRYDFVCVDEASMVSDDILLDLRVHKMPLLAIGDHGQLPPVRGSGGLMKNPMLRLERIHRQAEGNPIIRMAHAVRETGRIDMSLVDGETIALSRDVRATLRDSFGPSVGTDELFNIACISWMNKTRQRINKFVRAVRGHVSPTPEPGEMVVCLKNYRQSGELIANGRRGLVQEDTKSISLLGDTEPVDPKQSYAKMRVLFEDDDVPVRVYACAPQFGREKTFATVEELEAAGIHVAQMSAAGRLIDHGYALTVHKAQGSGFDHVIFYRDMPESHRDYRKLAYTAFSRARRKLTLVEPHDA